MDGASLIRPWKQTKMRHTTTNIYIYRFIYFQSVIAPNIASSCLTKNVLGGCVESRYSEACRSAERQQTLSSSEQRAENPCQEA